MHTCAGWVSVHHRKDKRFVVMFVCVCVCVCVCGVLASGGDMCTCLRYVSACKGDVCVWLRMIYMYV